MYGIFVNEDGGVRYAEAIVRGYKEIETRSRNMLRDLTNTRVAVVRTRRNSKPTVVGFVTIGEAYFCPAERFCTDDVRDLTLIPPGSKYDCNGKGKWFYDLWDPEVCTPYPLPADAIRHGRSWCEF